MGRLISTIVSRTKRVSTALIVDTDPSSLDSLCRLLAECQIRAVGVTNSVAAFEILRSEPIDILICEDLGGLYGVEVLEVCEALFPSVRRVYLARAASAELHSEAVTRGHVHATITDAMHPVDLRDTLASLVIGRTGPGSPSSRQ
jgi:response regulator RpfG family c-di-GMP phosphodiesterase